jgi:hypothetical protein
MPPSMLKGKGFHRQGSNCLWVLSCDIEVTDTTIAKICRTFLGMVKQSKDCVQRYYTPLKHWQLIWHNITVFINTALRIWSITTLLRVTMHCLTLKMTELRSFEMFGTVTPTARCHTAEDELWDYLPGWLLLIWRHQSGRFVARSGEIWKNVSCDRLLLFKISTGYLLDIGLVCRTANVLSLGTDSGGICSTGWMLNEKTVTVIWIVSDKGTERSVT